MLLILVISATEKIEPVHEKGSHSKEVEDLASSSVSHEKKKGKVNPEILKKANLLSSIDLEELRKFFTGKSLEEFDDVFSSEIGPMQPTSIGKSPRELYHEKLRFLFLNLKKYFEDFLDARKVDGQTSRTIYSDEMIESLFDVWTYIVIGSENLKQDNFDVSKLSQVQSKILSEINEATSVKSRNPINTFTRFQNLMDKLDEEQKFFLWAIAFVDSQDDLSRHEIKSLYDLLAGSFKNPEMNEEVLEAIELINLQFKRSGVELFNIRKCDLEYLRKAQI
ncbi:hypothetical protein PGTUg99_030993 [Puccinia graminis f. sp. tritici]|uniref:Uncharacterized protein n=1 Tax=Puccinia graminis f. sp. tritici TaxID=56615 RepID=A0A5B0SJW4_PUCGR|nr:hypothetical protein PGTUg99_030993 [Puccinia graminis f. sp. tritici]